MPSDHFYYNEENSSTNWSSIASNIISVPRLLKGKPCFAQPRASTNKTPKTLIIDADDLATMEMNRNQLTVTIGRLQALCNEGFNIHIHTNGKIAPIPLTTSQIKDSLRALKPKKQANATQLNDSEALKTKAVEQLNNRVRDQILILNSTEIERLRAGNDEDWQKLESFINADFTGSNISGASLTSFIEKEGSRLETLDLSGCINLDDCSLTQPINLPDLKTLVMHPRSDDHNRSPMYSNLPINTINTLIKAGLETLETIDLDLNGVHEEELNTLLASIQNIKHLKHCRLWVQLSHRQIKP